MVDVFGRDEELAAVVRFLEEAPSLAGALVLEGEAGIGKTTLWLHAVERAKAASYTVLSARPAESDEQLSFAGLADLLSGLLDAVFAHLPAPQRTALEIALALADPPRRALDRRTIAFAFLNVLRALAREGPVAIAIDDVQWLDPPSAHLIRFAGYRLGSEPVRLLVARRGDGRGRVPLDLDRALPDRLVRLAIGPLSLGALHEVLRTRLGASVGRPTLRRLHEACGGNPFYALEIGRALERQGWRVEPGSTLPLPDDLQLLLRDRLSALPADLQDALLVAALSAGATVDIVESVLGRPTDFQPAIDAKVITLDGSNIRFAHPLFATALQHRTAPERTRLLHLELSEHAASADERALHLALGTNAPDEGVADELAEAARAARGRGAPIAAAAFLEHALRLSPVAQPNRLSWQIDLAEAHFEAGDAARAVEFLTALKTRVPEGNDRARVIWRLAAISAELAPPSAQAVALYEEALLQLADPVLETRINTDLTLITTFANGLTRALEHGRRAAELAAESGDPEVEAEALAALAYVEFVAGLPLRLDLIERALALEETSKWVRIDRSPTVTRGFQMLWSGELAAARPYFERVRLVALERGDESNVSISDYYLALLETLAGNWSRAAEHAHSAVEHAEHTRVNRDEAMYAQTLVDAHRGRYDAANTAAAQLLRSAEERDEFIYAMRNLGILGFIELTRGHPEAAEAWLVRATDIARAFGVRDPGLTRFTLDRVEALVALGRTDTAEELLSRFEGVAVKLGRAWAVASSSRCRGLLLAASGDVGAAVAVLERATADHRRCSMPFELGRTLLALGTTQRRARQRRAARESLAEALDVFERLGAPLWAAKAEAELARVAGRKPAGEELTPTEARIAELVAQGRTNREVAAALVLAVHTVETALTRIYGKLGVRSRTELARRLTRRDEDGSGTS